MRKFSQNGIPTQKLTIENGYVRGIATYSATHSSPRIDTLRNYATDLGLIDGYQVTEKGLELLERLQDDWKTEYNKAAGRPNQYLSFGLTDHI